MTEEESTIVIEAMTGIPWFPTNNSARALISNELRQLVPTAEEGIWLATRATQLYEKWDFCGLRGFYQIWFSRYPPKNDRERKLDLLSGSTQSYPDGVPKERTPLAIEGPQLKALPPGHKVAVDVELEKLVKDTLANLQPQTHTPEEIGRMAKAAHPELAGLDDKYVGLKILAKEKRDEKRVDEELRALMHMPAGASK